jgi:hypothetical protein
MLVLSYFFCLGWECAIVLRAFVSLRNITDEKILKSEEKMYYSIATATH